MNKINHKLISKLMLVILAAVFILPAAQVQAAQATQFRSIMSRLKANTNSDHTIYFKSPTGIQDGSDHITLTFSADFTFAAENVNNFDFAIGGTGTCLTETYTEKTLVLDTATGSAWAVDLTGNVVTFKPDTDETAVANSCFRVRMGTVATTGATGAANTVQNGAADDDDTIVLGGAFGDSATMEVDIIADDQIVVNATVDSNLAFTIDDADGQIYFGSLSTSAAKWAHGTSTSGSASDVAAHTMTIVTNAASGYTISYSGALLTSGSNDIDAASITNDADGSQDTEQFAIGYSASGDATVASGYDHNATAANRDWTFVAGSAQTVVSETVPTATETISAYYLANISGLTKAGNYTTTLTYIATGVF
jgi:hypothetical protein